MADETRRDSTSTRKASSRILSKKAANRIAAAKAYVVAMKKAGEEVPEWVQELAKQGQLTSSASPVQAPGCWASLRRNSHRR